MKVMCTKIFHNLSLILDLIYLGISQDLICPNEEDYSPCSCFIQGRKYDLICTSVSLKQVYDILKRNTVADWDHISFEILRNDFSIQKDIISNHRAIKITINGNDRNPKQYLRSEQIHPQAFLSTSNFTKKLCIRSFDLRNFEWPSLGRLFHQLQELNIERSLNVNLDNLTSLRSLSHLSIINCTSWHNRWMDFPFSFDNGLERMVFSGCGLDNGISDYILQRISHSSNETLIYLDLSHNGLTRIPPALEYFVNIRHIYINNQRKPGFGFLSSIPISFSARVQIFDLQFCYITDIQPGAFQGFFL